MLVLFVVNEINVKGRSFPEGGAEGYSDWTVGTSENLTGAEYGNIPLNTVS